MIGMMSAFGSILSKSQIDADEADGLFTMSSRPEFVKARRGVWYIFTSHMLNVATTATSTWL